MASTIGSRVTAKVVQRLTAAAGPGAGPTSAMGQAIVVGSPGVAAQIRTQNAAADLAERSGAIRYPAAQVYCEKIVNNLEEKFRTFSGRVQMAVELRHSSDRLDGLQDALEAQVDTVTQTLTAGRGDWGGGMFYSGAYEVAFGAAKHGGRNYIQTAKVTFEIGVSIS